MRANLGGRIGVSILGYGLMGAAISGLLNAGLGMDAYDVLTTGVAHTLHVAVSIGILITAAVFIAVGFALGQRPGWGTLLGSLVVSGAVAVTLPIEPHHLSLAGRVIEYAISVSTFAVAISLWVSRRLGAGPPELAMLGVALHSHLSLRWARTAVEVGCVVAGLVFSGSFGIGTFIFSLVIGHLLAFLLHRLGFRPSEKPDSLAII